MRVTCAVLVIALAASRGAALSAQEPAAPAPAPAPPAVAPATPAPAAPQPAVPAAQEPPAVQERVPAAPVPSTAPQLPGRIKDPAVDARFKVRIMEGVLERAVEHAAKVMNQQLRTVTPDLVLLTGAARARGYRLDGYGFFFDVQVPAALRQSMGWTVRMMRQNTENLEHALTTVKRIASSLDGKSRQDAELAIKQIELQVKAPQLGPGMGQASSVVAANTEDAAASPAEGRAAGTEGTAPEPAVAAPAPASAPPPPINPLVIQNPDLAYEIEVRESLIEAMLEWGATLPLQTAEWLTVAARDNADVVIPGEAAETVTIIMRVKSADLAELRAGRLSTADVRRRVEVREF